MMELIRLESAVAGTEDAVDLVRGFFFSILPNRKSSMTKMLLLKLLLNMYSCLNY